MKAQKAFWIAIVLISMALAASAKNKNEQDVIRSFSAPVDKVYAAAVQVASADYNLKEAVKEGYTVNFFTGGQFSMFVSAVCHDNGNGQTIVTLSIAQSQGNPQLFGVGKEKNKLAKRFWAQLDSTLNLNQNLEPRDNSHTGPAPAAREVDYAQVTVKSTPDGAEINVDGKFSGNTPSTLHLSAGDHKLMIASRGFQKWERTVTITGGATTINATLEPDPATPH